MRLRALLDTDALGLKLLGGEEELDRTVRGVMTTDLRDPSRYLSGGELVLSGLAWRRTPSDSEPFVRILVQAGVAALAAGTAEFGCVPDDLVVACARHRLPLFAVEESVAFATVTEHVVRQVSGERAGDLAAVVERHRRMMTSGPAGGGPDVVLDLLGSDLDLRAWLLSPTGRLIAGPKAAGPALSAGTCARLAGEHLAAGRTGHHGPHRVTSASTTYSLFPIRSTGRSPQVSRDVPETVLSDWVLAVEADAGDWPEQRLDLLQGVTQLIAVERDRRDAARTVRRRLAQEVLELVQSGAPPAEVAARLRVAAPVLLPGLGAAPHWQVVVARVEWDGGRAGGGPVAQSLLEEILVDPGSTGPEPSDRIAVAHTGDEAVALVPLPAVSAEHDGSEAGIHADALLEAVREPLSAGLDGDGRLTLGVSAAVHSAEGLRGALEEARHARRVAAARP
uniref:PucR family transcriptional regulator ligand-binding domain-containing protein n=1 Tax=Streptomyces triticisoli TaxID=2182797 RepID=UPI000DDBC4EE